LAPEARLGVIVFTMTVSIIMMQRNIAHTVSHTVSPREMTNDEALTPKAFGEE
jgi:hypothetical protein